jgi:aminopeptidase N
MASLGRRFRDGWQSLYDAHSPLAGTVYAPTLEQVGQRMLRGVALRYLQAADPAHAVRLAAAQYRGATNMTDRMQALAVLADHDTAESRAALDDFYRFAAADPLLLDKWFSVQAAADRPDTVERVAELYRHPDFILKNPNRVRALIGTLALNNHAHFHRADGAGYAVLADACIALNPVNPQVAARLVTAFGQWRRYDSGRQALMESQLRRILSEKDLSKDVYEIVSKSLG